VPGLRASWQLSTGIAAALAVVWLVCRLSGRPALRTLQAFALEFTVVVGVFAVYQHTAYLVHGKTAGAFSNAMSIWRFERWLHMPSEVSVQRLTENLPLVEKAMSAYYAGMHLTVMTVFIVWMWWRHRDRYPMVRNTVALTTLVCVLIQMVPVAPPRMFPQLGFVDTAAAYGLSMYSPDGVANNLGAMPSVHVAWAGMIAVFGWLAVRSAWRWLFVGHFVVVFYVVVATANHWWMDGVVGLAVFAVVFAALKAISAVGSRMALARLTPASAEPEPAQVAG
jgi:hypothetical protein